VRDTVITFELEPPSAEEMAQRTCRAGPPRLAGDGRGRRAAGLCPCRAALARAAYDRTANLGVYLAMEARGRGLGPRSYGALIEDLAGKGFHSLAAASPAQRPSVALHERMGFTKVGHLREMGWKQDGWRDVGWWQKLL
jgi:phosphinothricin acetyltransferase